MISQTATAIQTATATQHPTQTHQSTNAENHEHHREDLSVHPKVWEVIYEGLKVFDTATRIGIIFLIDLAIDHPPFIGKS